MSKLHWLALTTVPGIGGATARRLLERFGSAEAIWEATEEQLEQVPRVSSKMAAELKAVSWLAVEDELEHLEHEGLGILTWDDVDYPVNLREVSDAPFLLFVRGQLQPTDGRAMAIVGTRDPTPEASVLAEGLACELASRGVTIVSGLALGIDSAAHRGALKADGGRTLAVPGSGLRSIHPRQNIPLAEAITDRGAVLSELHPRAIVRGASLMARDRIVSGLSRAVIVVAAAEQSGSMDTARRARRQGRLLLAVPGSPGTDALIAQGAEPLEPSNIDFDALTLRLDASTSVKTGKQLNLWT